MTILSWKGRHGTCLVGPTYAQGDRRDLGEMILELCSFAPDDQSAQSVVNVAARDIEMNQFWARILPSRQP